MENKKLIEQLKGVGFKDIGNGRTYSIDVSEIFECNFNSTDKVFWVYGKGQGLLPDVKNPTFEEILMEIKKRTGVDLSPKKTKREEIEELKTKVATMQGAIKSQNEAVEQNKKEAHRANANLTMLFKALNSSGVWIEKQPIKQASEMQADEKKGFKAGDRVFITCKERSKFDNLLNRAIRNKEIHPIETVHKDDSVRIIIGGKRFCLDFNEIEHATKVKALEFGDPLECLVSKFCLKTGQKVIFLRVEAKTPVTNDMRYIISTEGGLTYALRPNEVKPL